MNGERQDCPWKAGRGLLALIGFLLCLQACQVTVWVEDTQGKKRASHSICASLKADGSREYRIDDRIKSGKEVKV